MRSNANLPRYETDLATGKLTDKGQLMRSSWPGMYPIAYTDQDNSVLCHKCARKIDEDAEDTDTVTDAFINYEDPNLYCDDCSRRIESAYAEDEETLTVDDKLALDLMRQDCQTPEGYARDVRAIERQAEIADYLRKMSE